jgi:sugar phosphate isomerase/epimerase
MTDRRGISRRTFGTLAGAGLASLLEAAGKKIPIGVQLYSVRTLCARDLPGTMAGVAKLGYKGVEFAGYYNRSAAELRKMLEDNGLKCCGTHIQIDTLLGDNFAKTVEFNKTIGNRNLIMPGLPEKYRNSIQAWRDTGKLFNELAAKLKPEGLRAGYHNHSAEFQAVNGEVPWDAFFGTANKDVIMQLDIGHAVHAGADPVAVLKKYKGRAKTVHVKDFSATKKGGDVVGEGDIKWKEVLQACEKTGGTEWYIVEEESNVYAGLEGIERSLKGLHSFGR